MSEFGSNAAYLAFAAGVLSVLSPCVLPLMPAYLSMVSGISVEEMQEGGVGNGMRRRVMLACLAFVAGFSVVFVVMGVGAVAAGHVLRTWRVELFGVGIGAAQIAGIVVILLGLHMMGITPIRSLYRDTRLNVDRRHASTLSAFVIGAAFALGWSPCIGPILAAILTVAASRETLLQGVVLLLVYSAGLAVPFLVAGWSLEYFFEAFQRIKRHFRKLEIASGTVIVGVGFLVLTNQLSSLNRRFSFVTEWLSAAEKALQ
jgi:cytochrome c-type biogenesis protein